MPDDLRPLDAKALAQFVAYLDRHAAEGPWTWAGGELRDRHGVLAVRQLGKHSPELIQAIGREVASRAG